MSVLFVVPHAYRDPDRRPPTQRWIDVTAEYQSGHLRLAPTVPQRVQAVYGPPFTPVTQPPEGLTVEQRRADILADLLTPLPPHYLELADAALPPEVRRWLALDAAAVMVFTWLTPDSFEALTSPDSLARVHLVVHAVPAGLITNPAEEP